MKEKLTQAHGLSVCREGLSSLRRKFEDFLRTQVVANKESLERKIKGVYSLYRLRNLSKLKRRR